MKVKVPISVGELIDKTTILTIKMQWVEDKDKLKAISKELKELTKLTSKLDMGDELVHDLYYINSDIWHIESDIRQKEKNLEFDDEFIELARMVYIKNDIRAKIKNDINKKYDSYIVEQKSY